MLDNGFTIWKRNAVFKSVPTNIYEIDISTTHATISSMSLIIDTKYVQLLASRLDGFVRKKEGLWNCKCPLCGDSKTNPRKKRCFFYRRDDKLLMVCHNCSASTTFGNFLKQIDRNLWNQYNLEKFGDRGSRKKTKTKPKPKPEPIRDIGCAALSTLPPDHPAVVYAKSRKLPKESFSRLYYTDTFRDMVNEHVSQPTLVNDERIIIPYFSKSGNLIGVSGRAIKKSGAKYINIAFSKEPLVFGVERIDTTKRIFVTEGALDSLFLPNAVAISGFRRNIPVQPKSKCVIIPDNDNRNSSVAQTTYHLIQQGFQLVLWPSTFEHKDINAAVIAGMTAGEILTIIHQNIFSGLQAMLKWYQWSHVEMLSSKMRNDKYNPIVHQ